MNASATKTASVESPATLLATYATASGPRREALRHELIEFYLPLARSCASRYAGRGIDLDDLFQVACHGLTKAVNGYDPARGEDFLGYAIPTIRGELRRHFRDAGWMVRPPRRIQELQARLWTAETGLTQSLHRSPTAHELAEQTGAPLKDVRESLAVDGCYQPTSLDAPTYSGDTTIADELGGEDNEYLRFEERLLLEDALRRLGRRERLIIQLRFVEGLTQQDIGERIGVTQMQVSRLLTRILAQLRTALEYGSGEFVAQAA